MDEIEASGPPCISVCCPRSHESDEAMTILCMFGLHDWRDLEIVARGPEVYDAPLVHMSIAGAAWRHQECKRCPKWRAKRIPYENIYNLGGQP